MLKVITAFINARPGSTETQFEYLDELRIRTSNKRTELPNVTFRNPEADRVQLILEYYESFHDYHYAKIQLINCYLETFEHATSAKKSDGIAQILTNLIHMKPIICFSDPYFNKSIIQAKQSLLLHARLVEEAIKHITSKHKEWRKRYQPQAPKNADEPATFKERSGLFFSSLSPGLPTAVLEEVQTIVMHHPGSVFGIVEIIPELENIADIFYTFEAACEDTENLITKLSPSKSYNRPAAECVVLKIFNVCLIVTNKRNTGSCSPRTSSNHRSLRRGHFLGVTTYSATHICQTRSSRTFISLWTNPMWEITDH